MRGDEVLEVHNMVATSYADRNKEISINRDMVLGLQWSRAEMDALPDGVSPMTVNYMWPIVFKNMTFLVGRPPEISVPVAEDTPEARAYAQWQEKVLYGVYEANRMKKRFLDMAYNCSVAGGQPLVVDWDPISRVPRISTPLPERFYPIPIRDDDPSVMAGFTLEEFFHPRYLMQRFGGTRNDWQVDHHQGSMDFVTIVRYSDAERSVWVRKSDGVIVDERLGDGFVPSAYIPNVSISGGMDGLADATLLREPQKRLNNLLTSQAAVVEMYSDPTVILEGTGVNPSSVPWGPGLKLPIEQNGKVYFLQWEGTPPDFKEQVLQCITAMQDLSGIPDVAFGRYEASIQSGIALNTQFQPTRLLMSVKQGAWSDALNTVNQMALEMFARRLGDQEVHLFGSPFSANDAPPFSVRVRARDINGYARSTLVWPGMLPKDDMTETQTLLNRYQSNAVSLYTLLEQLGHESPADEIERIKNELADPKLHPELVGMGGAPAAEPDMLSGGLGMGGADLSAGGFGGMPAGMGAGDASVTDEAGYAMRGMPGMTGMPDISGL